MALLSIIPLHNSVHSTGSIKNARYCLSYCFSGSSSNQSVFVLLQRMSGWKAGIHTEELWDHRPATKLPIIASKQLAVGPTPEVSPTAEISLTWIQVLRISNCFHDLLKCTGCTAPWGCRLAGFLTPLPWKHTKRQRWSYLSEHTAFTFNNASVRRGFPSSW